MPRVYVSPWVPETALASSDRPAGLEMRSVMARELDDYSTPDFLSAEITCRACRSPVPMMPGTSPRGSSPRETTAHCWPVVASRLCALYPQPRAGDVGGACWVERVAWTSRGFGNVQQVENGLYNLVKY